MQRITQKQLQSNGMNANNIRKLIQHAKGSIYRMNAKTADCYAFNIHKTEGWNGGWDWSDGIVDTNANYIYSLKDFKFYSIA